MTFLLIIIPLLIVYVVLVILSPSLDYTEKDELLLWYNGAEDSRCYVKIF